VRHEGRFHILIGAIPTCFLFLVQGFELIFYANFLYFVERNISSRGCMREFCFGIIGNHFLINTLSVKLDVCTALHNLGSQVLI
jgi:hypothetical protein